MALTLALTLTLTLPLAVGVGAAPLVGVVGEATQLLQQGHLAQLRHRLRRGHEPDGWEDLVAPTQRELRRRPLPGALLRARRSAAGQGHLVRVLGLGLGLGLG